MKLEKNLNKGGGNLLVKRIEEWCRDNNTSIFALEKKCGIGNATIRGWREFTPTLGSLMKISRATGIPVEELIRLAGATEAAGEEG